MSEQVSTAIVQADESEYVAPFPIVEQPLASGEVGPTARGAGMLLDRDNSQATAMALSAVAKLELQMKMAMSYPRRIDNVMGKVAVSCANPEFADVALYTFPKGKTVISGPSIKLAEEIARHWGNINSGYYIVMDEPEQRTVRAWSWDLEANATRECDITFAKTVQKKLGGQTQWVVPDEKELQQLTAAKAAIGVRNMILALVPDQLKRDAVSWCKQTLQKKDRTDPDAFKKKILAAFARLGVTDRQLADLIGKEASALRSPADDETIEYLRGIRNRLDRGESSIRDIIAERADMLGVKGPPPETTADLRRMVNEAAHPKPKK